MTGRVCAKGAGSCLRTLRQIAGLTQREAARRVGYSRRFLRAVERGDQAGTPGLYERVAAVYAEQLRRDGAREVVRV